MGKLLENACRDNDLFRIRALMHRADGRHLCIATFNRCWEATELLLTCPTIDPNHRGSGRTPLHHAITQGVTKTLLLLLRDPRVDASLAAPVTPLWYAAACGYLKEVELLVASGKWLDCGFRGRDGQTARQVTRNPDIARLIEECEQDPHLATARMREKWAW